MEFGTTDVISRMTRQFARFCVRMVVGMTGGRTVRVFAGPIKGRRVCREQGLSQLSMLFGIYEQHFAAAFLVRISSAKVVYDIGANAGYFSLLAAHQTHSNRLTLAFEPNPPVMQRLSTVVEANGLDSRIVRHQLAFSNFSGRGRMFTPASDKSGVIESALRGQKTSDEGLDVEMSTLDQFVFDDGNPAPHVIKLDVEGAEALVLDGATRVLDEARPTILAEIHGEQPAGAVWDILVPRGYRVCLLAAGSETEIADRTTWMRHFAGSKWIIRHCVLTPGISNSAAA